MSLRIEARLKLSMNYSAFRKNNVFVPRVSIVNIKTYRVSAYIFFIPRSKIAGLLL
jgi:hypothetical protein